MSNEQNRYNVIAPLAINSTFAYSHHDKLSVGQFVVINFRNREIVGLISGDCLDYNGDIKQISSILPYAINPSYVKFCNFVAQYTMNDLGKIMRLMVPFSIEKILTEEKNIKPIISGENSIEINLNDAQKRAVEAMHKVIRGNKFKTILLHGVTGSGKTEVFLEFMKGMHQVLIIVPEISLSNELAKKVSDRLKIPVYIWHHSISTTKKRDIWKKAINGEKMAIVGARSALFIPFSQLECIVIDEEHDASLKQSEGIIYHARDMGVYLANLLRIPIILSSATPSLETYSNAINKKYEYIKINSKFFEGKYKPQVYVDDLTKQKQESLLSEYSLNAIKQCLSENKQVVIFINRRGHTPKILCSSCGWKVTCPRCDTWLCYHIQDNYLACHHCDFKSVPLKKCKECGEETLIGIGTGVEKATVILSEIFPKARIMSLSSDNMNTPNKISKILEKITKHEVDIIVGTQIIAKGHNFPALNTIIITCLDAMLYGDDFRTTEKAFQTTYQIAGRAGRFEKSGGSRIIYQTYNPADPLVQLISSGDINKFYDIELSNREATHMPPFGKMISILISSTNFNLLSDFSKNFMRCEPKSPNFRVIGPISPSIPKINNVYRLRFIILSEKYAHEYVKQWLSKIKIPNGIKISIDVAPQDFF